MDAYNEIFRNIQHAYSARSARPAGLICKQGSYGRSIVLKLQKAAWTNDSMQQMANKSGIFFSIWMGHEDFSSNRVLYNIHALKLRSLKGYRLTSIAFAHAFRAAFEKSRDHWPNVRTDYGPQTLMQGWFGLKPTFERDALALLRRFEKISPIIDDLLSQAVARPARRRA